ncbi:MAG: hypothetical protein JWO36_1566 [Myxococcales bacterium]|nr:hypothetical protein [Myxococcales bacterium]
MQAFRIITIATLAACSGSNTGAGDASNTIDSSPTVDAPAGSTTITGSVGGKGFSTVMSTYWIGMPDADPLGPDTVIYIFDKTVACNQITTAGWDTAAGLSGGQILEMKMVGTSPRAYPNTTAASHIPAKNESLSSYTIAGAGAADMIASGGSVTLSTLGTPAAGQFATGTFHITFSNGSLDGTFTAPYCAAGREP